MTEIVPTRLGQVDTVSPGTADRILSGIPANTQRSYAQAWATFETWCADTGRTPLPTTAATLADFVAHLCDLGRAPSTIEHRMAVVRQRHRVAGHRDQPDTEAAILVLRGYRRDYADAGHHARQAPPITRARLQQMSAACDRSTLAGRRDRLLLVIGWALAGRRSELAGLRIEDVTVVDGELEVLIRKSKTDKQSRGETVNVPPGEHVDTDPVGLHTDWLDALAAAGAVTTQGALFRAVTKHDRLYRQASITPAGINGVVKRAAERAGLPNATLYSAHSLRAGFATQAANDGVPMAHFARHGRWSPNSPVPAGYVRTADRRKDNPLRKMGL